MGSAQGSELAPFFGDLSKSRNNFLRLSYLHLTRFLVKREVDKPNGKTPGWQETFSETLRKTTAEGTADEESPLSSSGLVDAYKEDEESALDLDYPQPKVCFLFVCLFVCFCNNHYSLLSLDARIFFSSKTFP